MTSPGGEVSDTNKQSSVESRIKKAPPVIAEQLRSSTVKLIVESEAKAGEPVWADTRSTTETKRP